MIVIEFVQKLSRSHPLLQRLAASFLQAWVLFVTAAIVVDGVEPQHFKCAKAKAIELCAREVLGGTVVPMKNQVRSDLPETVAATPQIEFIRLKLEATADYLYESLQRRASAGIEASIT